MYYRHDADDVLVRYCVDDELMPDVHDAGDALMRYG